MAFYSFIGIAVTSATLLIYGEAIWDPVALMAKFKSPVVVAVSMFGLTIATLSTNIAANVVAPANSFANMAPKKISFKVGGYITGILGILIFPWKLIADPDGYIFRWLIAYSALLGALAGIMICDYYIVRKTQINLAELFNEKGIYKGWNKIAWLVFVVSLLPVIPGFLVAVGLVSTTTFPQTLVDLYSYAWFITFGISFILYAGLMKKK
jgi:NCS1 family nucleobase:cation symporter-1